MGRVDSILVGVVVALAWLLVATVREGRMDAGDVAVALSAGALAAVVMGRLRPARDREVS